MCGRGAASGRVEWWLANRVGVALFQAVLDAFAAGVGAGPDKIVIIVLDRRCAALSDEPAMVSAYTSFHWWPEE